MQRFSIHANVTKSGAGLKGGAFRSERFVVVVIKENKCDDRQTSGVRM